MEFPEEEWIQFKAKIFKTLGNSDRLKIIRFLAEGEKCVCEIFPHLDKAQPSVSRHLQILKDCGIIKFRKDGTRHLYSLTNPQILEVLDSIDAELTKSLSQRLISKMTPL